MKNLFVLALAGYAGMALASDPMITKDAQEQPAIKKYEYGMKMDVAKVISISAGSRECIVGPAWMTYEDSQGERHTIEYRRMGDGC